jgi:hypothetical protein
MLSRRDAGTLLAAPSMPAPSRQHLDLIADSSSVERFLTCRCRPCDEQMWRTHDLVTCAGIDPVTSTAGFKRGTHLPNRNRV